MSTTQKTKTLRLLIPQWQGGGENPVYPLGAKLLAWLAPDSGAPLVEVPVTPYDGATLKKEDGVMERTALIRQLRAARSIIDAYMPDRIVTFGGDCLVSQAPFAYLNERYDGGLGILWLDTHPDVRTPNEVVNAHAMVLGNLLGEGDAGFAAEVKAPVQSSRVFLAGLQPVSEQESECIRRLGIRHAGPEDLAQSSATVLQWLRENEIRHLAIHLDLDVLDPALFRALQSTNPDPIPGAVYKKGAMSMPQVIRLVQEVSVYTDVVALSIAEHMPWDIMNLQNMMKQLPLLQAGVTAPKSHIGGRSSGPNR